MAHILRLHQKKNIGGKNCSEAIALQVNYVSRLWRKKTSFSFTSVCICSYFKYFSTVKSVFPTVLHTSQTEQCNMVITNLLSAVIDAKHQFQ